MQLGIFRSSPRFIVVASLGLLLRMPLAAAQSNVVAWGNSNYDKLVVPASLTNAVSVAGGVAHSAALRNNGKVIVWGDKSDGQGNVPSSLTNAAALAAGAYSCVALRPNGQVVAWPSDSWASLRLPPDLTNAVAISAGADHALALCSNGTVVVWGDNYSNQTNVPSDLTNVVAVAAGWTHSLALRADGSVVAWGGQSYVPAGISNVVAIAAGGDQSVVLRSDGTVLFWDPVLAVVPTVLPGLSNVIAISACEVNNVAGLKPDGTVAVSGANDPAIIPAGLSNVVSIASGAGHNLAVVGVGPPFVTNPLVDRTIVQGQTAYFHAEASGSWPLSFQWQFNGTNLPGATAPTLALSVVQPAQAGTYTLVVSNAQGTASVQCALSVIPQNAVLLARSLMSGHFWFQATANQIGVSWTVQSSSNLVDWSNVGTAFNYNGTMNYSSPSNNRPFLFYRLQLAQ